MAQKLASQIGLAVGFSSRAIFLGAVLAQAEMREEPVRDSYLAPEIELLGFRAFNRTCETCWDPEG